ncbi:protein C10-like [Sycon ciliatum]|uniref:protein C10-like n=1 Tax=Sycon ciliatum TaxID=27933 RepID=UPI0020AD064E|eukprot:scpid73073/ scgid15202/ Protein C10
MEAGGQAEISLDQATCKQALRDVVTALQQPENLARVEAGLTLAGDDPMKRLMLLTPIVLDIEKDVIAKYGFTADQAGVMRFMVIVKQYEAVDAEIQELSATLRAKFLPS